MKQKLSQKIYSRSQRTSFYDLNLSQCGFISCLRLAHSLCKLAYYIVTDVVKFYFKHSFGFLPFYVNENTTAFIDLNKTNKKKLEGNNRPTFIRLLIKNIITLYYMQIILNFRQKFLNT